MTNRVILDNIKHQGLRVMTHHAAVFGDAINQVLIFPTEYAEVQREYPILFQKDATGHFISVALLGLDRDENLFLNEDGWQARYIPAVQARGPFLIGYRETSGQDDTKPEPMIHVDLDHPRIVHEGNGGEPVFLPHGGNSPYLESVAMALRLIHQGMEVSKNMFAAFDAAGIIAPVALEIKLSDTEQYNLSNYYTVSEEHFRALDGPSLARLHRHDYLQAAFMALSSLGNVSRLIDFKNRKRATT